MSTADAWQIFSGEMGHNIANKIYKEKYVYKKKISASSIVWL